MPRPLRFDPPGALHHLMIRGVEKRTIFLDDDDRWDFLERLARLLAELGFVCLAWAFLPNHVHLLVRRQDRGLPQLMARLTGGYAQYFNRKYTRVGHLFQGRYRSRLVEDDADLGGVLAYVLANPVRHRLIRLDELPAFPWSMYGAFCGARPAYGFEAISSVRGWLEGRPGLEVALRSQLAAGDPRDAALEPPEGRALAVWIEETCLRHGLSRATLGSRQRAAASVREELGWRAREAGISNRALARMLGISEGAVRLARRRALVRTGV